jgi:hypothetical protein
MGIINFFDKFDKREQKPLNFMGHDNEDFFLKNLETMPEDWHYRTKKISYANNSHGYRTKEFDKIDWKNSIVVLGCSHTYGAGVAIDETFSHYLSLLTNREVVNMGVNSGSNELMMNNCAYVINNFEIPYAFVFNWTDIFRFIYYIDEKQHNVTPWIFEKNQKDMRVKINNKYVNILRKIYHYRAENYIYLKKINYNYKLNVLAMIKDRSNFFDCSISESGTDTMQCKYFENKEDARDLSHMGKDTHQAIANYIFEEMKKNNLF